MAHQVQFIQLSQDEYDNLSSKNTGSLYFTTDTHRIYKGETLYASTTFDQLKFDDLSATSIKVDGVDVSLEGHTHTKSEIDDFPENVSDFTNDAGYLTEDDIQDINFENLNATSLKVDNKNVSLEGHTHTKSEIEDFPTNVSSFTNDVGYLTETDLQDIEFGELEAESLKVDGKDVSVEGHTHTKEDIEDFPTNVSSFTNDAGYITINDVDLSECSKVGHTHSLDEIEGWDDTDLKFTNLNAESLKVNDKDVSLEGHTHKVDELDGWRDADIEFGSIEAEQIKVNDKDVSLEGHKHTTSDIEGLENIKTGAEFQLKIPSQSVDKTIDKLVVNKLTSSEYEELKSTGTLSDEELYFVDSNVLDASGNTIPNVANPVNATDAATKGYVDTQVGQARQDVVGIETRIEENVKTYVDELLEGFDPGNNAETEAKLTGITETGITKSTGTITTLNSTTLTAGTLNAANINLTGTFNVDDMEVVDLTATNMNVTVGLKISGKPVATQEYVEQMISEQIDKVLTQEEF